ncbi:MAG: cytochrome c1 [Alphaproteobacteria bacterium]|nr:cytochrome c1 [Alphaproteobacteria bacterium]
MTLRTKTLTAALALTISATGFALAQDGTTTTVPMQPADAQTTPEGGTTFVATPADQATTDAPAAAGAPDAGGQTAVPSADTPPAEAQAEALQEGATQEEAQAAAGEATAEATGDVPQNPGRQQPDSGDEGADAVRVDEGGMGVAPVETQQGTSPIEEHFAPEEGVVDAITGHGEEGEAHEADHGYGHVEDVDFSFEGPFGSFDQFQLQRGLQVYTEVCSACHGMKFVPIRTLTDEGGPGLPEDQVRAYANELLPIFDEDLGEERARVITDNFPAVNGDGMGPDLSLMAKARAGFHGPYGTGLNQLFRGIGGPEYIHALLTGYNGEEVEQAGTLLHGNTAFPGGLISMAPPLSDDRVTYEDGTPATVDQMAMDVAAFLMWTAEPKMMDRKAIGIVAVLFLIVLTALLYLTNKRIWSPHKQKRKH